MSIRVRLLILLLGVSLLPMALLGVSMLHSLDALGERVGSESRKELLDAELARLRQKVADAVVLYGRQGATLEHLIRDQVAMAESALAERAPEVPWTLATDFDSGNVSPLDFDARYQIATDGTVQPLAVSLERIAIHFAPGVSASPIAEDTRRLASLAAGYAALSELGESGVLWHYTSLESGVHSAYPGHGGYPIAFDPRQRGWYREARASKRPIWSPPFVDVSTRAVVTSVAAAIRGPDGEIAGVTGIDVSVPRVFNEFSAEIEGWRDQSEAMIVHPSAERELEVRGHERPGVELRPWQDELDEPTLPDPRGELMTAFDKARALGQPVLLRHEFRESEALWAIAQIPDRPTFLVVVVPVEVVMAAADRLEDLVAGDFAQQSLGMGIALLGMAALVILVSYRTAHGFTRPMQIVAATARAIEAGDLGSRAHLSRRDEIGTLADSVNHMAASLEKLVAAQEEAMLQSLKALTKALQKKDRYTAGHSGRVKHYSIKLGERLGLDSETLDLLGRGALLHDLGKIGIPDAVLNKPAPLDEEEYSVMQQHPSFTASIMRPLVRFRAFAEIAAWHHERWDGTGYPDGLVGHEIPLLAQIVAIADAWDAMTGDRIYRKGIPIEKAISILESEADDGQFDPALIRRFLEMVREDRPR
jgi:HD-GYP domain-containing protein (c-di-GMP phosphodiesterase class II)